MNELPPGTDAQAPAAVRVAAGAILAFRLYDIADTIDLGRAQELWTAHAGGTSARGRLSSTPAKAVAFDVPPLVLSLDPLKLDLDTGPVMLSVGVRLYDFGVVSLILRAPVIDVGWADFCALANALAARLDSPAGEAAWSALLARLRAVLGPAMRRPLVTALEEDYLIGFVQSFSEPVAAADLAGRVDLVALLSGEQRPLSPAARADLLRRSFSYYADDLAVLTWDRAFIHEPRGDSDVVDIIEVANAQLLEMRYYDELLDDELPRMYEAMGSARRGHGLFGARRFALLARRFQTLVAEVTELTEKVDNALQVTEDVYLARVYAAALDLFRVRPVNDAVNRKLAIMRETYTALYDEASAGRSEMLEILIVFLIALELVLAALRH